MIKIFRLAGMAGLALMLSGCVSYEALDTRIDIGGPGKTATIVMEYQNVSSDGKDQNEINKDFDQLIYAWKGDQALVNMAKGGVYAKSREVFVQDGKIIGRVTGLTEPNLYEDMTEEEDRWNCWLGKNGTVIETNGTAYEEKSGEREGWHITWPKTASKLYWKYTTHLKFEENQKVFLEKFQQYLKQTQPIERTNP